MSENEDKYHDTILDLEEKLKKNVDMFLKIGNSLQAMFMLGPKPLFVYDQQLKHGLGYPNPYTLRQAISEYPKLYVASRTGNIEIPLNVRDSEETLEEAFKSQQKMNAKMNESIAVRETKQNVGKLTVKEAKTYAYGAIRAENQNLLVTISELKARMKNGENGMNETSSVKRPKSRDSHVKTSVLDVSKNEAKKEAVYVRKNKQTDNTFANVVSNKENVIDVAVANASKAKTLLSPKTRFSEKATQSKTLDTTSVASKSKIDEASASKARDKVVQIVLWVVDSGCSKHMTGDRSLLRNFVEKFMGTVRFGNDNFAAITGYVLDNFVMENLEVAFRSKTWTWLASSPICPYVQSNLQQSPWLWHRRLSHLNFGPINDLTKRDLVTVYQSKYWKVHLCSAWKEKSKKASIHPIDFSKCLLQFGITSYGICAVPMRVAYRYGKKYIIVIAWIDFSRFTWVPEFLWAEAVATACFTQNWSIINTRHNKTPYELLRGRNPNVEYFHVFGSLCYPTNDRDDLGKMKPKADIGVFIGYSKTSRDFNNPNSSNNLMNTPSKEDLDNLFGPMFEDYFKRKSSDTTINSAAQPSHDQEGSPSTSSYVFLFIG
ncbi:retrovirus-related pol polyprotein from transposon TNT 1-94 [Tanacetum coccineum]